MATNNDTTIPELKTKYQIPWIEQHVNKINDRIKELELLGIKTPFEFELDIMQIFPEFYQTHPFLVKKLCKREDLSMLYKMMNQLQKIEDGDKSMASVELKLGEELAEQYLYPKIKKNK